MPPIAFFVQSFPELSETFILNQITGLIDKGKDVQVIAIHRGKGGAVHEDYKAYDLSKRTTYLLDSEADTGKHGLFLRVVNRVFAASRREITRLRFSLTKEQNFYSSRTFHKASKIIQTAAPLQKFDIIFAHYGPIGSLAILLRELGFFSGPIATFFHGFDLSKDQAIHFFRKEYQTLFEKGELMFPVSHFWHRKLLEWGCPDKKIRVHRMGINPDVFQMQRPERPINRPVKMISVGRITEKKGLEFAVKAVAKVAEMLPIDYAIIGTGETILEIKKLIKQLKADNFIHCLGDQTQERITQFLAQADIFLLPSVTANNGDMEGIPVALMESMAMGLITVSTRHSGIPELITNGVDGYLAPERDVNALAEILLAITNQPISALEKMRRMARFKIESEFNTHTLNEQLLELAMNLRR